MNLEQKNQLVSVLSPISSLNISDVLKIAHGDHVDLGLLVYDNLTIIDITFHLKEIINDFKIIVETDKWKWLPFDWNHPFIGTNNVFNHLQHINSCLTQSRPFQEIGESVKWLKLYLLSHNCDSLSLNNNKITDEQIEKRKKELEILNSQIDIRKKENDTLKDSLLAQKNEIQQFFEQKQNELKAISDALSAVSGQKAEIDNIYKNVANSDSEIRVKFQNQEDLLSQMKTQKESNEKEFKLLLDLIHEEKGKLDTTLKDSDLKLKFFEGLENFVKEKQKEIIELGALAAGAALGGTFGLRESKLNENTNKWIGYIPLATLASILWLLLVFTKLKSDTGDLWIDAILNLTKTVPIFVLLGFVFKQYNKERNLQEEYAFKAAIANTIKAYSDLLREEDNEKNTSKQGMLLEAIRQVQNPPKLYTDSAGKIFSFSTKGLSDSIKNLNETISNLKGK